MTSRAFGPLPRGLRRRHRRWHWRRRPVTNEALVSVAGVIGAPVFDAWDERVGSVEDLVVHWERADLHPPLAGAVVRDHHRRTYVPMYEVAALLPGALRLRHALQQLPVQQAPWLVGLRHLLDRQIVDVDGAEVARISDLVLSRGWDGAQLVGADISARTLLRRAGPASLRRRVASDRVYDWSAVAALSDGADPVIHLTAAPSRL